MFAFNLTYNLRQATAFIPHATRRAALHAPFALMALLAGGSSDANANAGTAVPPFPGRGTLPLLSTPAPDLPAVSFDAAAPSDVHGFTAIGFIQNATVSGVDCPTLPPSQWGGTAVIDSITITIPCNMIVQMPAATFTWADLLNPSSFGSIQAPPASLTLASTQSTPQFSFPSTEMHVDGNVVAGRHIAGLVFISQQSLNSGTGYITGFDYENAVVFVSNTRGGASTARLQINDPKITDPADPAFGTGRYSAGISPDTRFAVDQQNPTIHAITGYPMCVPRTHPAASNDPRCPQKNRPLANVPFNCRNFGSAGVALPTLREMAPPTAAQKYCSNFVMKAPPGTPQSQTVPAAYIATASEPDARQQAPLEIGDLITWSGTLLKGDHQGPGGTDTISVHTIDANVGIFTQPGTLPVYLVLGEFKISAESPLVFGAAIPQEPLDRLVVEGSVTDVTSIVDAYLVDIDPAPETGGGQSQRWVTPASMTSGVGGFTTTGDFIDGGITTQFTGLTPGRIRMRANKSVPGILRSPTRSLRIVARSLCDPININAAAPLAGASPVQNVPCLHRAPAANGLYTGQYSAPFFSFIFPEAVVPGDNRVPYDLWNYGFIVLGEGPGTGPLIPHPW